MQRKRLSKDDLVDRIRDGLDKKGWEITKRGRNPATGERITIPARKVIKARPVKNLRDLVAAQD